MSKFLYLLVKNLICSICLGVDDEITDALFCLGAGKSLYQATSQ